MDPLDERASASSSQRHGRVGAHAAGVRALVAVAGALEVLRRAERHGAPRRRRARTATPPRPRAAPRPRSRRRTPRGRAAPRRAPRRVRHTKTPLPAASPSALTTHGARGDRERRRAPARPPRAITSFANASSPRSAPPPRSGPKTAIAGVAQLVGDAGDERRLGPDHDEVDGERRASASSPSPSSARTGWHVPSAAMPGIAGRGVQLGQRRALRELPGERMLARARSDHSTFTRRV